MERTLVLVEKKGPTELFCNGQIQMISLWNIQQLGKILYTKKTKITIELKEIESLDTILRYWRALLNETVLNLLLQKIKHNILNFDKFSKY
jgi:hypothetical protein